MTNSKLAELNIMARLSTDVDYRHAEDAEAQAAREEQITAEIEAEVAKEYAIRTLEAPFLGNAA